MSGCRIGPYQTSHGKCIGAPLSLASIRKAWLELRSRQVTLVISHRATAGKAYRIAGNPITGTPTLLVIHPDDYDAHPEWHEIPIYRPAEYMA